MPVCQVCGETFYSKGHPRLCPDCRITCCPICGKEIELKGSAVDRLLENGWVACGSKHSAEYRSQMLFDREGIVATSQRPEVAAKISAAMQNESPEQKAARKARFIENTQSDEAREKRKATNLEHYGVENVLMYGDNGAKGIEAARKPEVKKRRIKTMVERHGFGNQFQNPEVLKKAIAASTGDEAKAKRAKTNLDTYGYEQQLSRPEVRAASHGEVAEKKRILTSIKRYGVTHPSKSKTVKDKVKATNIARYGVEFPMQSQELKNRVAETRRERYGFSDSSNMTRATISKFLEENPGNNTLIDVAAGTGIDYYVVADQNSRHNLGIDTRKSYYENRVASLLDELGVEYVTHCRGIITPLELDFYCPNEKVAIEVNDTGTHNSTKVHFGSPKPEDYHWRKTQLCQERGVRLIHAWQHCFPHSGLSSNGIGNWDTMCDCIKRALGKIDGRANVTETEVIRLSADDAADFFEANCMDCNLAFDYAYALVPDGMSSTRNILMAYSVAQNAAEHGAEITMMASKIGVAVDGGAEKLWEAIKSDTEGGKPKYRSITVRLERDYFDAEYFPFLKETRFVNHEPSSWDIYHKKGEIKAHVPGTESEIGRLVQKGEVKKMFRAGTDTFTWERN